MDQTSALEYVGPPGPESAAERERWDFQARVWRMMYGVWTRDLDQAVRDTVGPVRREAWGVLDMTTNLKRTAATDRATLYDPVVDPLLGEHCWSPCHRDLESPDLAVATAAALAVDVMRELCDDAGLAAVLQRHQRDVIGIREALIAPSVEQDPEEPERLILVPRRVWAHHVCATATNADPTTPQTLDEWRMRVHGGRVAWLRDHYARGEPMRVFDAHGADVSAEHADPRVVGIPHVVYHAALTGALWDPYEEGELYRGTITQAVAWSLYQHVLIDVSWQQRYTIGLTVVGAVAEGSAEGGRSGVVADPASLMQLVPIPGFEGQPSVGAWVNPVDPLKYQQAVGEGEKRLIASIGIGEAEVVRAAGDAQSGYALAVSREQKERIARRYAPAFRRADAQLLCSIARAFNAECARIGRPDRLPERGWFARYPYELAAEAAHEAAEAAANPPAPEAPETAGAPEAEDMPTGEAPMPRDLPPANAADGSPGPDARTQE